MCLPSYSRRRKLRLSLDTLPLPYLTGGKNGSGWSAMRRAGCFALSWMAPPIMIAEHISNPCFQHCRVPMFPATTHNNTKIPFLLVSASSPGQDNYSRIPCSLKTLNAFSFRFSTGSPSKAGKKRTTKLPAAFVVRDTHITPPHNTTTTTTANHAAQTRYGRKAKLQPDDCQIDRQTDRHKATRCHRMRGRKNKPIFDEAPQSEGAETACVRERQQTPYRAAVIVLNTIPQRARQNANMQRVMMSRFFFLAPSSCRRHPALPPVRPNN